MRDHLVRFTNQFLNISSWTCWEWISNPLGGCGGPDLSYIRPSSSLNLPISSTNLLSSFILCQNFGVSYFVSYFMELKKGPCFVGAEWNVPSRKKDESCIAEIILNFCLRPHLGTCLSCLTPIFCRQVNSWGLFGSVDGV